MEKLRITTEDQVVISANLYTPNLMGFHSYKGGVIINSATGVKQGYYAPFAEYLMSCGYVVVTYDYRGIGDSNAPSMRDEKVSMTAWGEKDLDAVILHAKDKFPDLSWHCVGHSVGGQLIGLAQNSEHLSSVFTVAAQSGNWRFWHPKYWFQLLPTWYVLIPLLSRLLGYFPGNIIGGEHLPKYVALDWARWCRNRQYICDVNGQPYRPYFSKLTIPMHFLVVDDDTAFAPEKAVHALAGFYENALVSISKTHQDERQGKFLGHFGFFRKKHEALLWSKIARWLDQQSEQVQANA